MAIIRYGAGVTEIVGSIGGWTFQKNPTGNIIRLRPRQKKNPTEKQSIARNNHIKYLQEYQALSLEKKQLWRDYAELHNKENAFAQTKKLTGQNWFESTNHRLKSTNQAEIKIPPTYELPVTVPSYSINLTKDKFEIVLDGPFYILYTSLIISTTYPVSLITKNIQASYRLTYIENSMGYTIIDITEYFKATHKIPYPPSQNSYGFLVSVMIQTVNRKSGIASAGLIKQKSLTLLGIGINAWKIEDTFIVYPGIGLGYVLIDSSFYVF